MGEAKKGNGLVTLAYIHPGEVDGGFHESIVRLLMADHNRRKPRIFGGGGTIGMASGTRIATSRNELVQNFLRNPAQPEWLLMIDADMVFGPLALEKVLEAADPVTRPIVGGLCFGGGRSGKVFPTLYRLRKPDTHNSSPIEVIEDYPADAVVKVDATGAAFLLMHRTALEKMGEAFKGESPWFSEGTVYMGMTFGEDWAFCMRAKSVDIPIHVHTGAKVGHVKPHILDEEAYAHYRAQRDVIGDGGLVQKAMWRFDDREAVDAPTYAVIPFKGKHEMTHDLVWQLSLQDEAAGIVLLNNGDELTEEEDRYLSCGHKNLWIVEAKGLNIHQMWNEGIRIAQEDVGNGCLNIAFLNNDLRVDEHRFLSKLAIALRADDRLWAVSPRYDDRPERGVQYVNGTYGAGGLAGFAFMVKGEAFTTGQLPTFDENIQWWYGDDDLVLNIAKRGHRIGIVLACTVEHLDGGSQTSGDTNTPEWQRVILADREYVCQKHGLEIKPIEREFVEVPT